MENELPAKGGLKDYSLPQILTYLNNQKKTGVLIIENKNAKKSIYIKEGNAIFAFSNQDEDNFGRMLVKAGKITSYQCDESVKLVEQTGKYQGTILVELGYLTPHDLFHEVKRQIKEIILSLFLWEDGMFSFKDAPPVTEVITLDMSMEALISEGARRIESKKKEEEDFFIQKVNELYENIERLSYYDILKTNMNAPFSEIKRAYLRMARDYHPDRYNNLHNPSIKNKLTALFTILNKAYNTLSDETERKKYDAILLKKSVEKGPDSDTIRAEEQFRRGVEELKTGNPWGAVEFLRWASRLNPQKALYWFYLSSALSKIPKRGKEAEEAMLKAIELEPNNANYHAHLGEIYVNAGLRKRAIQQFKIALDYDPTNKNALKELEKLGGS